jgi:hypothetical protein
VLCWLMAENKSEGAAGSHNHSYLNEHRVKFGKFLVLLNWVKYLAKFIQKKGTQNALLNTLRTGDADLRLYAYKQFKYPVPNVLTLRKSKLLYNRKRCKS